MKLLDYGMKSIPTNCVPHDYQSGSMDIAKAYFAVGQKQKAEKVLTDLSNKSYEYARWYLSLDDSRLATSNQDCVYNLYILDETNKLLKANNSLLFAQFSKRFEALYASYSMRTGGAHK
jgi:hypothetical protein